MAKHNVHNIKNTNLYNNSEDTVKKIMKMVLKICRQVFEHISNQTDVWIIDRSFGEEIDCQDISCSRTSK